MIYEIKKAFEALRHPGIRSDFLKLVRNALPYYLSPNMDAGSPLTIYWSINSLCNLRCKMCDVGTADEDGTFYKNLVIDGHRHEIDINVFKSVIDEVKEEKPFIAVNSTEPLIYKPLLEAIEYCSQRGLETAVTTGGYTLPKMAKGLAEAGLKRLNVSIDGPPRIHNEIRRRQDSFERSVEGIREFREASRSFGLDSEIYVSYVITNMNYQYLVELAGLMEDVPLSQLNFTYLWFISPEMADEHNKLFGDRFPVSTSCYNEFTNPVDVDIEVLLGQIQQLQDREKVTFLPNFSLPELRKYYKEPKNFIKNSGKCLASWFIIQILADGRVIPYTRCHNESLGNINERSFQEIWNGEEMKSWRRFIQRQKTMPMCKRCDMAY